MTTPLEVQHITLTCRNNRTDAGAWDEAVRRLREIYDAQVHHDPGVTLSLTISHVDTVPLPEGAKVALRQRDAIKAASTPTERTEDGS